MLLVFCLCDSQAHFPVGPKDVQGVSKRKDTSFFALDTIQRVYCRTRTSGHVTGYRHLYSGDAAALNLFGSQESSKAVLQTVETDVS